MNEQPDYPLKDWQSSELLKEAAIHLRDQPEYVQMNPAAKVEMTRFCHAVRRELMAAKERRGYAPYALNHMEVEFGLKITVTSHSRYRVHVHGHVFTIILGLPNS